MSWSRCSAWGQPSGLSQKCCQKIPFNIKENAEREEVSFEWQRQLQHFRELKALLEIGEKLALYSAVTVCLSRFCAPYGFTSYFEVSWLSTVWVHGCVCGGNRRFTQQWATIHCLFWEALYGLQLGVSQFPYWSETTANTNKIKINVNWILLTLCFCIDICILAYVLGLLLPAVSFLCSNPK